MEPYRFGTYHLEYDPEKHEAYWGARLIFSEVAAGGRGLVGDRQSAVGDPVVVSRLFPAVDIWLIAARKAIEAWTLRADDNDILEYEDGDIIVRGSPQKSCGYLYVSAAVRKATPVA